MTGLPQDDGLATQPDRQSTDELLAVLYQELRRLAAAKLAKERPGQTLQPTALVHEAYLRLERAGHVLWDSKGQFMVAAAEAMRRILVENARRKKALKRGGESHRLDLDRLQQDAVSTESEELLALSDALDELQQHDLQAASLVKLRYFGGLKHIEAARALGISRRAADRLWATARAWLFAQLNDQS